MSALERDKTFAPAWAALADCISRMAVPGWIDWDRAEAEGCRAAWKAVEADPENGTAMAIAAFTLAMLGGKLDEAMRLAENALRLHPNSSVVCTNCGWVFTLNGSYERAIPLLETARRMSPIDPRGYLFGGALTAAYLLAKRYEDANVWASRLKPPARRSPGIAFCRIESWRRCGRSRTTSGIHSGPQSSC